MDDYWVQLVNTITLRPKFYYCIGVWYNYYLYDDIISPTRAAFVVRVNYKVR